MRPDRIYVEDVQAAGLCLNGARYWFSSYGLDFRDFVRNGVSMKALAGIQDAQLEKTKAAARKNREVSF